MTNPQSAQQKAAATYNAASDYYDANAFWDRYGRRTIERLPVRPGDSVLDVCCGTGASAIPAAEGAGPGGRVLGIDLAEDLLRLAREKARGRGLTNIEFQPGDMLATGLPEAHFDAVVCVFGIFFVPDMAAAVRELWRVLRPGGRLAITTWGPGLFEPLNTAFWNAVRETRPDLYLDFNPWDRVCQPDSLRALLEDAGVADPEIAAEPGVHPTPTLEHAWAVIQGTGYRRTVDQLNTQDRERIRNAVVAFREQSGLAQVQTNVVYAVAVKSGSPASGG